MTNAAQVPGQAGNENSRLSERPAGQLPRLDRAGFASRSAADLFAPPHSSAASGENNSTAPPYPFRRTDAGRAASRRSRQRDDFTVRALALAKGMSYDEAYNTLAQAGRKCSRGFRMSDWLNTQSWAKKISFPAIKGERRMNPVTFCSRFRKGIFICKVSRHVFTIIDGIVYDDFQVRSDRCIYTAWEISSSRN